MSVRTDLAFQIDSNATDGSRLLDDVDVTVLDADLHDLDIELIRDDVTVCVAVSGARVCEELGASGSPHGHSLIGEDAGTREADVRGISYAIRAVGCCTVRERLG